MLFLFIYRAKERHVSRLRKEKNRGDVSAVRERRTLQSDGYAKIAKII